MSILSWILSILKLLVTNKKSSRNEPIRVSNLSKVFKMFPKSNLRVQYLSMKITSMVIFSL